MILCIRCSRGTKTKLDSILESGEYADYAEVIASAIDNLHLLLTEVGQKGALVLGEEASETVAPPSAGKRNAEGTGGSATSRRKGTVPELFQLREDLPRPSLATLNTEHITHEGGVSLHEWIFGQFNKLLPAKAGVRALANLASEHSTGFDIDNIGELIAAEAVLLGTFLHLHDERSELPRDKALAVAFPSEGDKVEKSKARFAHHFVGSLSKHGMLSGILSSYRFLAVVDANSQTCCLTEQGWQFAVMENAALDGRQDSPTQRFTDAEVEFLLEHISKNVPEEAWAFRAIAQAIREGADTPTEMDALLSSSVPKEVKAKVSAAFLSTQRSGVISRMSDIGLLTRVRDGTRVRYSMTDSGTEYIAQLGQE